MDSLQGSRRLTYQPDAGSVFLVEPERTDGKQLKLGLLTSSCTEVDCACISTEITTVPVNDAGELQSAEDGARLLFDPIERTVELEADPQRLLAHGAFEWIEAQLTEGEVGAFLTNRAKRLKLKHVDKPWRRRDWSDHEPGEMVPYFEAIPGEFDLFVDIGDDRWWLMDLYCVAPGCPCTDVVLDGHLDGKSRASLRVDLDQEGVIEGAGPVDALWAAFCDEHGVDVLRARRSRMREMADDVGSRLGIQTPVRAGHKVGRNDPCPCGSGKKFKKCCA